MRPRFDPGLGRSPGKGKATLPTSVFWPELYTVHGGHKESDMTERLSFSLHFHFQYSCLRNPMDRGARWAAVCGIARESDMT